MYMVKHTQIPSWRRKVGTNFCPLLSCYGNWYPPGEGESIFFKLIVSDMLTMIQGRPHTCAHAMQIRLDRPFKKLAKYINLHGWGGAGGKYYQSIL